jgi:hypothetical protein
MSVVTRRIDDYYSDPDSVCSLCEKQLSYPHLVWTDNAKIFFCAECCHRIKRGLTADLVHIAAIVDLRKCYGGLVLVRQPTQVHEAGEASSTSETIYPPPLKNLPIQPHPDRRAEPTDVRQNVSSRGRPRTRHRRSASSLTS